MSNEDSRSGSQDYDDNYSSRSSSYRGDDYRYSGNQGRGQGHGGWFGDPEGHSEAARRGHHSSNRYSTYDYDDRDRYPSNQGRGQSHGGWFGDPEGHSEAARRGWKNR